MTEKKDDFDWASAALSVAQCDSSRLVDLAKAAHLSPENGDLADIDLSNLDLRGQDFTDLDLRFASFDNSLIAGASFRGAQVSASSIIRAKDWERAKLPNSIKADAQFENACRMSVRDLPFAPKLKSRLLETGFGTIRDIVRKSLPQISATLGADDAKQIIKVLSEAGFEAKRYKLKAGYVDLSKEDNSDRMKFLFKVDYKLNKKSNHFISYTMDNENVISDDMDDDEQDAAFQ